MAPAATARPGCSWWYFFLPCSTAESADDLQTKLRQIALPPRGDQVAVGHDPLVTVVRARRAHIVANARRACHHVSVQRLGADQELCSVPNDGHEALFFHEGASNVYCLLALTQFLRG